MSFYSILLKYKYGLLTTILFLGPTGIILFIIASKVVRQNAMLNETYFEFGVTLKQCGCHVLDMNITGHSKIVKKTRNQSLKYGRPMVTANSTEELGRNDIDFLDENFTRLPHDNRFKLSNLKLVKQSTKNIFLVESSCGTRKLADSRKTELVLTPRQWCAVESAATAHPLHSVYLLHTCPLPTQPTAHASHVTSLRNVFILNPSLDQLFQDSPLQQFFLDNRMESSEFPVHHASDILRLLLLWRFGGTYLDLDVIVLRSLEKLGTNFIGFETRGWIANGIMNFEPTGHAHRFLERVLLHLDKHYDPRFYSSNGPVMMTTLVKRECYRYIRIEECKPISLYLPNVLYPVSWIDRFDLVNSTDGPQIFDHIKRTAFTVHCWNGSNANKTVRVGSSQAYALLAEEFCPIVYQNCGEFFY